MGLYDGWQHLTKITVSMFNFILISHGVIIAKQKEWYQTVQNKLGF